MGKGSLPLLGFEGGKKNNRTAPAEEEEIDPNESRPISTPIESWGGGAPGEEHFPAPPYTSPAGANGKTPNGLDHMEAGLVPNGHAPPAPTPDQAAKKAQRMWNVIAVRQATLLGIFVLIFLGWMAVAGLANVKRTEPFDLVDDTLFPIKVSGCDIFVEGKASGTQPEVELDYWVLRSKIRYQLQRFLGTGKLRTVIVDNDSGCDVTYKRTCADICKVTVRLPPEAYGLWLQQLGDDRARDVRVIVRSSAKMQNLRVVGPKWMIPAGPTLQLQIEEGAEIDNVAAYTNGGQIISYSRSHVSVDFWSKQNSARLMNVPVPDHDVVVKYRQPEDRVCVRAVVDQAEPPVHFVPTGEPFDLCPILDYGIYFKNLIKLFDTDKDHFIGADEYHAGMKAAGTCCGGNCPMYSNCKSREFQVFSADIRSAIDSTTGLAVNNEESFAGVLSDMNFAVRVAGLNFTGMVPNCKREVMMEVAGASNSYDWSHHAVHPTGVHPGDKSVPYRFQLRSEEGEVQMNLMSEEYCHANREEGTEEVMSQFSPGGTSGIRMLQRDAKVLMKELQQEYEMKTPEKDVFAVIDVMPSPGVPETRWIYTSREMYLSLEPAHIQFLSNGILLPRIRYFKVHFTNHDCENEVDTLHDLKCYHYNEVTTLGRDYEYDVNATVDIYQQLRKAIIPRAQPELRGALVMINTTHCPSPDAMRLIAFVENDAGEIGWARYVAHMQSSVDTAAALSVAIGVVVAVIVIVMLEQYGVFLLERRQKVQKLKARQLRIRLANGDEDDEEEEEEDAEDEVKLTPFQTPLKVLTMVVVQPVRKQFVNSLKKFVTERCIVQRPGKGESWSSPAFPHVFFREFRAVYSTFSFQEDLRTIDNANDLQRQLIAKYKLHVRAVPVVQLRGMRWREHVPTTDRPDDPEEEDDGFPPSPDAAKKADTAPTPAQLEEILTTVFKRYAESTKKFKTHSIEVFPSEDGSPASAHGEAPHHKQNLLDALVAQCQGDVHWGGLSINKATLDLDVVDKVVTKFGGKLVRRKGKMIRGLKLKDMKGKKVKRTWVFYAVEMFTVCIHVAVLYSFPIFGNIMATSTQDVYAMTTAMDEPMIPWKDLVRIWPVLTNDVFLPARILYMFNAVYCGCALLRIVIHYFQFPPKGPVSVVVRNSFAVLLALYLVGIVAYIVTILVWCVLASVLNPGEFLPLGTGAVVVVVLVVFVYKSMGAAAASIKKAVKLMMDTQVYMTITNAAAGKMLGNTSAKGAPVVVAGSMEAQEEPIISTNEDAGDAMTAQSIFEHLDEDDSGILTVDQFRELFVRLDLPLTADQKERMFEYCDLDCSGTVTLDEFTDGWTYIQEEINEQTLDKLGLGAPATAFVLIGLTFSVGSLVAFVYIGITMWNTDSNFTAIMSSMLITGGGAVSSKLRKASKAENGEDPSALVNSVLSGDGGDSDDEK